MIVFESWQHLECGSNERDMVELEVDCFCSSQSRGLGRIQNGGVIVLLPAAVVACCDQGFW